MPLRTLEDEHVGSIQNSFTSGVHVALCSCGWRDETEHPTDAAAREAVRAHQEQPQAERKPSPVFDIEWGGEASLSVQEIWPDGDAPENPTRDDVIAVMQKSGSLRRLLCDWNLDVEGVEVNGNEQLRHASSVAGRFISTRRLWPSSSAKTCWRRETRGRWRRGARATRTRWCWFGQRLVAMPRRLRL
jgi:hypothetical protein